MQKFRIEVDVTLSADDLWYALDRFADHIVAWRNGGSEWENLDSKIDTGNPTHRNTFLITEIHDDGFMAVANLLEEPLE